MIGCQPSQSAVMSASVEAGKILDLPSGDTLSDGTAGGVEENSVRITCSAQGVGVGEVLRISGDRDDRMRVKIQNQRSLQGFQHNPWTKH